MLTREQGQLNLTAMKKSNMKLNDLRIVSFVTSEKSQVRGGGVYTHGLVRGGKVLYFTPNMPCDK